MLWNDKLYLGQSVERRYRRIKWKIMHNIPQADVFLLLMPLKYETHLQLVPAVSFLQIEWPKEVCVVGIASRKQEGMDLIEQITQEMYDEIGKIDYYVFFGLNRPEIQDLHP